MMAIQLDQQVRRIEQPASTIPSAVASAAVRAGIHYLDVTAEQPSAQATFDKFDKAARDAGVLVIPAMGFFGGFADLLVTAVMGDWVCADEIRVGIALDSWHPTRGTRVTGERNTAQRMIVADGRLAPLPQPAAEMDWDFPEPFARQSVVESPVFGDRGDCATYAVIRAPHLSQSHRSS